MGNVVNRRGHESAFSVYAANPQIIPSGVPTLVNMGTGVNYDLLNELNTTTYLFTPSKTGYYIFNASVGITNLGIGDSIDIYIYLNAVARCYNHRSTSVVESLVIETFMSLYVLPTDVVGVYVQHNFGANRNLTNGENFCRFSGRRIK